MTPEGIRYRKDPNRPTVLVGDDGTAWQLLEPKPNPAGYMRVTVGKYRLGRRQERLYVAHLVLRAFVGIKPEGMLCRHLDDDKSNNRLDNLAYGTWQDNANDRVRNGHSSCGSSRHNARLHESQIPGICRMVSEGLSRAEVARRLGVSPSAIAEVVNGTTWKHVPRTAEENATKIPK